MDLRNSVTGVLVSVSDDTAAALGHEWVPAEEHKPKAAAKRGRGKTKPEPTSEPAAADTAADSEEAAETADSEESETGIEE
ncbi:MULTISPECIES: hypothetical protein [unclassified Leucobacter]|uniref:DUF7302 family protein n=1 Tax=unclassified Leucobacter TaxID=2621730 RepID=UPI00165DF448|nr:MULTISPECIES: hypothetical protein [unclassified Leucobacter]